MQLNLTNISYTYPGASLPALSSISATFPEGWSGIIGDNGCGKTTLALIAARIITSNTGFVAPQLFSSYCMQDSSVVPDTIYDFASNWSVEAIKTRKLLELDDEWLWRYDTLSGGQQKRIQIACALAQHPNVLVMDEPTNDLDLETKVLIKDALMAFKGIGLLISHDRDLLDSLVSQSLVFEDGRTIMRPGGYSKASSQALLEYNTRVKEKEKSKQEYRRIKAEAQRRNEEAERQKTKRSRAGLDKKDRDSRERIGLAIFSGKDGVASKQARNMKQRLARANDELVSQHISKRYDAKIEGYGCAAHTNSVTHLEEGVLTVGEFALHVPELWVGLKDHITLSGRNGTGKTLVIHHLLESIPASVRSCYIPQNVNKETRAQALQQLQEYDSKHLGDIFSLVGRLNSDPERLLAGQEISPGELKKLMLSEQLLKKPHFLILDEPTNHLDVGSIKALQEMLVSFPGAFIVVSHDAALLRAVSEVEWRTEQDKNCWRLRVG